MFIFKAVFFFPRTPVAASEVFFPRTPHRNTTERPECFPPVICSSQSVVPAIRCRVRWECWKLLLVVIKTCSNKNAL